MSWNLSVEIIEAIVVCIIYTYNNFKLPHFHNRIFNSWVFITLFSIFLRILSQILIRINEVPSGISEFVDSVYLVIIPSTSLLYYIYIVYMIWDDQERKEKQRLIIMSCSPYVLYILLIVMNLYNGKIIDISADYDYVRGPLFNSVYYIFYFYCLIGLSIVLFRRHTINKSIKKILIIFPLLSLLILIIQSIYPDILLAGVDA
ncbi:MULTISPECIES: hypothetical protein, partial [Bacillus]|uniref:hypothetical protein n=1 Tax=Bacillus TaxID=1386 RepID=UPI000556DABF